MALGRWVGSPLGSAGRSESAPAASLGVDRETVRSIWRRRRRPESLRAASDERGRLGRMFKGWLPELANSRLRQGTWTDIDQHREYLESLLGTVTVTMIHQCLRDEHKLQVSISAIRRWSTPCCPTK